MSGRPEPRFDLDYARGRQAELWVQDLRAALQADRVEVKHDERARETGNLYVEFECLKRGSYRPSGIAVTEAEAWVFVLENPHLAVVVSTVRLKELARASWRLGYRAECQRGDHPTRGVLIPIGRLFEL